MSAASGCTFCRIVAGELPAHLVLEDDGFVAFLDTRPLFPGHVLLVPRAHHETLMDLPRELVGPLFAVAQDLSRAVPAATGAKGVFNAVNNVVSQSVPHLHVHVVPRNPRDGLRGFFWPRTRYADDEEAAATAARIRARLPYPPAP
ncbi:MAG: HIT domain-containing protein [Actinomycetota bacterium]|nr:HIT domain-containing protein [Actinomycetota bacterium]